MKEFCQWGQVEGVRVGRFNLAVNTTFVVFRVGTTLIEAGPPNCWPQVREFAAQKPLETVLLTHHHEDHSGNGANLQKHFGARVLAPKLSLPLLGEGFPIHCYRRALWGVPPRLEAQVLPEEFDDACGHHWRVIASPGHSEDMVCLLETGHGWLFSADLYVASKIRYARPEDRLALEIKSLERALQQPFEQLFCSHRGLVPNGRQALQSKLDYLVSLRQQVQQLAQKGLSLRQIQHQLLREGLTALITGWHFCKANLIRACLAA